MHQTPNFNSGIRATGFHMLNFNIHIFEKISKLIFFWYMKYIDGSSNLKFDFRFNSKIYSWYVDICIDLKIDLERVVVHMK